jgi:beta-lactamase regulating signal transducer with metallopeptidase domain
MVADLILIVVRANLAGSTAILLVLALRTTTRRWFGALVGYGLWLVVPLAIAGSLSPSPIAAGPVGTLETLNDGASSWLGAQGHLHWLVGLWLAGFLIAAGIALWRQLRFTAAIRAGRAGPAAVGVIQPRFVTPADFAEHFTPEERRLIRAHELAHIDRRDARCNALVELAAWLCWFNPLVPLAVRALRLDQELACDATVMERLPASRRAYAQTLLRTHTTPLSGPLGCQWAPASAGPLGARIALLTSPRPSQVKRDVGLAMIAALGLVSVVCASRLSPPYRAPLTVVPTVVLIDLAPPDHGRSPLDAWVYRSLPSDTAP